MTSVEPSYARSGLKLSLLSAGAFLAGTNSFVIAGLLPAIARDLQTQVETVSYSITAYALTIAVVAPLISVFLARVSRTALLVIGLAMLGAGGALSAEAGTLAIFTVGRVLAGVGAAALVPTATAAAAGIVPPHRRGRALAIVGTGFTLATAIGAPFGTALGDATSWRVPLLALVGLAVLLAVTVLLVVRDIPLSAASSFAARLVPLRDWGVISPLLTTILTIISFNIVYIFSSSVTAEATGGSGTLLAILLLSYGVTGVIGNIIAGPLTDAFGSRRIGTIAIALQTLALALLPFASHSLPLSVAAFALWGIGAFGSAIPVQHRIVAVNPDAAQITLSWFSTVMYTGIAIAPLLASPVIHAVGAEWLPAVGASLSAVAIVVFLLGWVRRQPSTPTRSSSPSHFSAR